MSQRIYYKLLNFLVNDITINLSPYPYKVIVKRSKHVSLIEITPKLGIIITGTCTDVVMETCKRHSLAHDFGCVVKDGLPCFLIHVYNF